MQNKFLFFYSGIFSNFYPAPFISAGQRFATSEQYFMSMKAATFMDPVATKAIMATDDPMKAKMAGRKVIGYDEEKWAAIRYSCMMAAVLQKFSQNPDLKRQLIATAGKELVEASPTDRVWGIGLSETDPRRFDRNKWRGQNLLGKVLMELRDHFLQKEVGE